MWVGYLFKFPFSAILEMDGLSSILYLNYDVPLRYECESMVLLISLIGPRLLLNIIFFLVGMVCQVKLSLSFLFVDSTFQLLSKLP